MILSAATRSPQTLRSCVFDLRPFTALVNRCRRSGERGSWPADPGEDIIESPNHVQLLERESRDEVADVRGLLASLNEPIGTRSVQLTITPDELPPQSQLPNLVSRVSRNRSCQEAGREQRPIAGRHAVPPCGRHPRHRPVRHDELHVGWDLGRPGPRGWRSAAGSGGPRLRPRTRSIHAATHPMSLGGQAMVGVLPRPRITAVHRVIDRMPSVAVHQR